MPRFVYIKQRCHIPEFSFFLSRRSPYFQASDFLACIATNISSTNPLLSNGSYAREKICLSALWQKFSFSSSGYVITWSATFVLHWPGRSVKNGRSNCYPCASFLSLYRTCPLSLLLFYFFVFCFFRDPEAFPCCRVIFAASASRIEPGWKSTWWSTPGSATFGASTAGKPTRSPAAYTSTTKEAPARASREIS